MALGAPGRQKAAGASGGLGKLGMSGHRTGTCTHCPPRGQTPARARSLPAGEVGSGPSKEQESERLRPLNFVLGFREPVPDVMKGVLTASVSEAKEPPSNAPSPPCCPGSTPGGLTLPSKSGHNEVPISVPRKDERVLGVASSAQHRRGAMGRGGGSGWARTAECNRRNGRGHQAGLQATGSKKRFEVRVHEH